MIQIVNPLGIKGLGEIGIVGVAAAIAIAVFHATGKCHHELAITLDKVLWEKLASRFEMAEYEARGDGHANATINEPNDTKISNPLRGVFG